MNIKNKKINYKNAITIIISGIIGAIVGCQISFKFNNTKLKKLFGIFLLAIAIFEIYEIYTSYRKDRKANTKNK